MKRVLITGGSGFIGRRLASELSKRGDHVTILTRDVSKGGRGFPAGVRVAQWDPRKLGSWADELEVVDAIVNLAGEPVAQRWTDDVKKRIIESRVESTSRVVEAIARAKRKPSVLVNASAIGFYPTTANARFDEDSAAGKGFLADVVNRWETAAKGARDHGVRDVELRIGVVLGEGGGALDKMILPFKVFAGGPIGTGEQILSWVHRDDVVGLMLFAIDDERVKGPINAVSPNAVTNAEMATAIGDVMNRPSKLRTPAFAMKLAMGEAAEIVLEGSRVYPTRAVELGYEFRFAKLLPALEDILGEK